MKQRRLYLCTLLVLPACASIPSGPSVMALPGSSMSFDQFRLDDGECRQYAAYLLQNSPNQAAADRQIGTVLAGSALGAAAGAAMGGEKGALVGAGMGLLMSSLIATGQGDEAGNASQQNYDFAYTQCMYGKGHRVPVFGQFGVQNPTPSGGGAPIPPPPQGLPPPPPGR